MLSFSAKLPTVWLDLIPRQSLGVEHVPSDGGLIGRALLG